MMEAYKALLERYKELMLLSSVNSLIHWDFETYMPPGATAQRSAQLAVVASLIHAKISDPKIGGLLNEIQSDPAHDRLPAGDKRNVQLVKREHDRATKLPPDLVKRIAKQTTIAVDTWKKARAAKDFSMFLPELERNIALVKEKAECIDAEKDQYDVLLDLFEPGIDARKISKAFTPLRDGLVPLVKAHSGKTPEQSVDMLTRKVPTDVQKAIARALMSVVDFDLARGRLDETLHPFTVGIYDDVRITTNYHVDRVFSSIYSVLHEAGHGIYEQNLPAKWQWQPIGNACSMGIHESQSRLVENVIGRSREFWQFFLPVFKAITGSTFKDVSLDTVIRAVNEVRPSKIRIEADEVTYSLHVIMRFELEDDLMHDRLTAAELPQAWNEKMAKYFGLEIDNDSEGVMQDTHWASGLFGYFPDYALGNVYDGMFLEVIEKEMPDWREKIATGNVEAVIAWLSSRIHSRGNSLDALDLVKDVTGKEIDAGPFLAYLDAKMRDVHGA